MIPTSHPINTTSLIANNTTINNSSQASNPVFAFDRRFASLDIDEPYFGPGKIEQHFISDLETLGDHKFCQQYLHLDPNKKKSICDRTIQWLKDVLLPTKPDKDNQDPLPNSEPYASPVKSSTLRCKHEISAEGKPKVFADYHTNKLIHSLSIDINCWYKSHKMKHKHVVNNGFELKDRYGSDPCSVEKGHPGFGTYARPLVGGAHLNNQHYYEWQILTARIADLDGFLVEWGYLGLGSADRAMIALKSVLEQFNNGDEFAVVPVWIPQWTQKASVRLTNTEKEQGFKAQLEAMTTRYYQDTYCTHYQGNPLLFVLNFWGRVHSDLTFTKYELQRFFKKHPDLAHYRLAYAMTGAEGWHAAPVNQIISNYPWVTPRARPAQYSYNSFISDHFVRYGDHDDVRRHVSELAKNYYTNTYQLPIRSFSVSPGVDTRGAPWSPCDSYLPEVENGQNTYQLAWNEVRKQKPDLVVVETFNDFSEQTHIEPTDLDQGARLLETAYQICKLKNRKVCEDIKKETPELIAHAERIYEKRIELEKIAKVTGKSQQLLGIKRQLDAWSNCVFNKKLIKAREREHLLLRKFAALPYHDKTLRFGKEKRPVQLLQEFADGIEFTLHHTLLNNRGRFAEGDMKLLTRTEDGRPHKITLTAYYGQRKTEEEVASVYTPPAQLISVIRIPITLPFGTKYYGKLASLFRITHPGCSLEVLEVRTHTYDKKKGSAD